MQDKDVPKELKNLFGSLTQPPKTEIQKQIDKLKEMNDKIQKDSL